METKNQMNGGLKDLKSSFETNAVKSNLISSLQEIQTICKNKEYVVEGSLDKIISDINLESSTLSSRKKLAKKIYYFTKKKSRKTMSALISFTVKRFLSEEYRVKIKLSLLEQEIISLRENYKKLYVESEAARIALKEKKKLLYEKYV
jgi:hypothetical protein